MKHVFHIGWLLLAILSGCAEPPALRSSPEGAFARLAPCVDAADPACLLHELDKDSRGAMYNIAAMLLEMRTLVDATYPADPVIRESAFGPWRGVVKGNNAEEMFARYCAERNCLGILTEGFGVVRDIRKLDPATVELTTMRGAVFSLHSVNGEWGLSTYRKELMAEDQRLRRSRMEVRQNAAAFTEQRRATGKDR